MGFGANLAEDHPGYHDDAYKQRRVDICNIASTHVIGSPIPSIKYSPEESAVWATVMEELQQLYPLYACKEYLDHFPLFDFRPGHVPQLEELKQVLQKTTGFGIRPVAGLLHPRDFLNGLAFSTFHSTQFIRHHSNPDYTPEPDLVHEALGKFSLLVFCCAWGSKLPPFLFLLYVPPMLAGHVPMLADPDFCDLVRHIGIASLGADEKQIWHLTKCYWYTVEFGVVQEGKNVKAFGAGLLSSYRELKHMATGTAELVPFNPFEKLPAMSYKDGVQKRYFVLSSFEHGAADLRRYCRHIHDTLPPEVRRQVDEVVDNHVL